MAQSRSLIRANPSISLISFSVAESGRSCLLARTSSGTPLRIYFCFYPKIHLELCLILRWLWRTFAYRGYRWRRGWRWCWGSTFTNTAFMIWIDTWWSFVRRDPRLEIANFYTGRLPCWSRWLWIGEGVLGTVCFISLRCSLSMWRVWYWGWWFCLSCRVLLWLFLFIFCSRVYWRLCRRSCPW